MTSDVHDEDVTATGREVRHLLGRLDGLLGLAIYRGEGSTQEWKDEAHALLIEIRGVLKGRPPMAEKHPNAKPIDTRNAQTFHGPVLNVLAEATYPDGGRVLSDHDAMVLADRVVAALREADDV